MTYTYGVAIPTNGNGEHLREVLESLAGLPTPPQAGPGEPGSAGTRAIRLGPWKSTGTTSSPPS